MQLQVENVNVDIKTGTVIVAGFDTSEIITELGAVELLDAMDYSDIMDYVVAVEKEKADEDIHEAQS